MSASLPIFGVERELVATLKEQSRLVLQAPTGSGKSTQVPQIILDHGLAGDRRVVILQPRRLATRLLAKRVAEERSCELGKEVGYQVRMDDRSNYHTRIKFETEGVLLRQMLSDPRLEEVGVIIFDEFHERHLYGDVTLARALALQKEHRPDLKLVVMSATLDVNRLLEYLEPASLIIAEGRTYPVEHVYLPKPVDPKKTPVWSLATQAFEDWRDEGGEGDVLVFMPGAYEIHRTLESIKRSRRARGWKVLPLHGELPAKDQDAAVAQYGQRKVVVATNVAETSLTIDGVRAVIDCGLARVAKFDPYRGINTLLIEKISRASAEQRAGRAGRTAPGTCLRLWSEREHGERPARERPEIERIDLAEIMLNLKSAGVEDLEAFNWIEPPTEKSMARAIGLLEDLGAFEPETEKITPLGQRMVQFPMHPRYARMLLAAGHYDCVYEAALMAALTQDRSLMIRTKDKEVLRQREAIVGENLESDFLVLLRCWSYADQHRYELSACKKVGVHAGAARQVTPLFRRFLGLAEQQGLVPNTLPAPVDAICKCILAGFSDQVAVRRDKGTLRCELVHGRRGELARESVVHDHMLVVASDVREIERRRKELNVLLTIATAIKEDWLDELFPGDINTTTEAVFDPSSKRVVGRTARRFRDLVLAEKRTQEVDPGEAAELLADELGKGKVQLKQWDHAVDQLIYRIGWTASLYPEAGLPDLAGKDRRDFMVQLCQGMETVKALKESKVLPVLRKFVGPAGMDLVDKVAPAKLSLPTGRNLKVVYSEKGQPMMSARIQDLYDVEGSLKIGVNREPVLIQVLGPNHRPVQVTQDLTAFWRDTYPDLKSQMQKRYPKHEWR